MYTDEPPQGFSLLEVLLALAIIAIAFTALLKASAQSLSNTARLKDTTLRHWVGLQAVASAQLGILPIHIDGQETAHTTLLNTHWYWRVKLSKTPIHDMEQLTFTFSNTPAGPFAHPLVAFRRALR